MDSDYRMSAARAPASDTAVTLTPLKELAMRAAACRLCWRITGAVFGSILIIESLILIPSAMRFESEALQRLALEAKVAVEGMLAGRTDLPLEAALRALNGRMQVRGLAAVRRDGTILAAVGEPFRTNDWPGRAATLSDTPVLLGSADRARLEVARRGGGDKSFAARLDASHVASARNAYVLRIAGLVAVIVLFVTSGTMLVLHLLLLRPLMQLRESMRAAAVAPERATEYAITTARRDELGEMISAHNVMLSRVADSIRLDRETAEARERFLVRHDALTGMANRRAFLENLSGRRAGDAGDAGDARGAGGIKVCLVNVVQLRSVNAALGQQAGDRLLKEIGARLLRASGPGSFVAHLGAGRFAVARRSADLLFDAATFPERLIRDAAGEYGSADETISVALRLGIVDAPYGGDASPEEVLNQAELALERTGESCPYAFFENAMALAARERQAFARGLERALARDDEIFLVYQAKASLAGYAPALAGAEALVRWRHPERGLIRPDLFVPIAESTGLIQPLGERVLRAACAQMRQWLDRHGRSPRVAVNLSAHQFKAPGLVDLIQRLLRESELPAELLELEITESAAMRDVEHTARTVQELRGLGLRLSIDDFGTGHSSLNYLRRFAFDTIKIDKSFVDDIGRDANADAICTAILGMAHALGRSVVAEGVETASQLEFLQRRGCEEIQGYLFARPVPAGEFEARFLRNPA